VVVSCLSWPHRAPTEVDVAVQALLDEGRGSVHGLALQFGSKVPTSTQLSNSRSSLRYQHAHHRRDQQQEPRGHP
jgi:hypothetical protein